MVPINVYRKIHTFHHRYNRKDNKASALDTFVCNGVSPLKIIYFYIVWYISVFFGGFFLHSLVSLFLFLFIPPKLSKKISPAFRGWKMRDQGIAILLFTFGIAFHLCIYFSFGHEIYLYTLGYPLLSFAWVFSCNVYIFHYKTTVGSNVQYNVRSLHHIPILSWILMNFNEHMTHHQLPDIPWFDLPNNRKKLPPEYECINQNVSSIATAIIQQIKGPRIIDESNNSKIRI